MALIGGLIGPLSACGTSKKTESSAQSSSSTTSRQTKSTIKSEHSSSSSAKQVPKSIPAKAKKSDKQAMDFAQIKRGNYRSLTGTWTQVISGVNKHDGTGTQYESVEKGKLSVSANHLRAQGVKLSGQTLTDQNGNQPLTFKQTTQDALIASVPNDAAISWAVTFYPKGTSDDFLKQIGWANSPQNLISIWTSNNSYTQVFAQKTKSASSNSARHLNAAQLVKNNFTSLVGTWRNPTDGKVIIVTNKTMVRPAGSSATASKGAVVKGPLQNGYAQVITADDLRDDAVQGGIGSFESHAQGSTFEPLNIVPKHVQLSNADDSDQTQDRLILGGGQAGYRSQAYYRE